MIVLPNRVESEHSGIAECRDQYFPFITTTALAPNRGGEAGRGRVSHFSLPTRPRRARDTRLSRRQSLCGDSRVDLTIRSKHVTARA
jgi:hypothetical protein